MSSSVELSLQLQVQDIAAVRQSFSGSLAERTPDTLWWLVDNSENIAYENRVKGSTILAIDNRIMNVDIGSFFAEWFSLQNAYFSQDQPFKDMQGVQTPPQTLQAAIAQIYRWRVPQYFNDMAIAGSGQGVSPQYVFPYQDFNLGIYAVTGSAFTKGVGPVNSTVCGPGILRVAPYLANIGGVDIDLTLTVVYPDGTTGTIAVNVPLGSTVTDSIPLGGTALTAPYAADTDAGVVHVTSVMGFKTGPLNLVVITEDNTVPGGLPLWTSEVAEVKTIGANQLTLRQPTLPGAASPFLDGLRNNYTPAAKVYPLFNDVNAVTGTGGTSGDQVLISFHPDWAQGFVDVSSIVVLQSLEGQSRGIVEEVASRKTSDVPAESRQAESRQAEPRPEGLPKDRQQAGKVSGRSKESGHAGPASE